jgi:hypothetical protein
MLKRFTSHTVMALAEASLVAMLIVGLLAGTAFAGKGGGGKPGGGTTTGGGSLVVVDMDGDGTINYGDDVTFRLTTSATRPYVSVNCYQGGSWVYAASVGYFADYPWDQWFTLATSSWPAGSGDCTAQLYTSRDGIRINVLGTTTFSVAP